MSRSMLNRSQGTKSQQTAQQIRSLANYSLALQRNTKLNAEQRLELLRAFAVR